MSFKFVLAAATLALMPSLALAEGCSREHAQNSCEMGQKWDDATQSCITPASS